MLLFKVVFISARVQNVIFSLSTASFFILRTRRQRMCMCLLAFIFKSPSVSSPNCCCSNNSVAQIYIYKKKVNGVFRWTISPESGAQRPLGRLHLGCVPINHYISPTALKLGPITKKRIMSLVSLSPAIFWAGISTRWMFGISEWKGSSSDAATQQQLVFTGDNFSLWLMLCQSDYNLLLNGSGSEIKAQNVT